MNMLFLTLMYPDETMEETIANSKDGLQNQINSYQRALVCGIDECLKPGEALDIVNALPVGVFPSHYRKLWLSGGIRDGRVQELGSLNLPWFKQRTRQMKATRAILSWAKQSAGNRTLLLYTLYLPYLKAVASAKRQFPDLKAVAIVTDLPNELGLASGRQGLMKRVERTIGMSQLSQSEAMDGFVLLTQQMAQVLPQRPHLVMEGLILGDLSEQSAASKPERPVVLYTGTLNRELGIDTLLSAFEAMPEYDLWLCGGGDMAQEAEISAGKHPNIRYLGVVRHDEALRLQAQATALINPRTPKGLFTRYSFPSKTLEYMRSGKPVLCYQLEGIPSDYDPYLCYIQGDDAQSIANAVKALMQMDDAARNALGLRAREYVCEHKNPRTQCDKILRFLRSLT